MAGDDQSDPFFWDESRVVRELCTPIRSWTAPPVNKLPDPATLEAKLRECGVEGDALLTYADEFSFELLWKYLGITKLSHQLSLKEAIAQFRKRSPRYREWKRSKQLADRGEEDSSLPAGAEPHDQTGPGLPAHLGTASGTSLDNEPAARDAVGPTPVLPELAIPSQGVLSPALSPSAEPSVPPLAEVPEIRNPNQPVAEEPSTKKRRIAPITTTAGPTNNRAFAAIPTEGDVFLMRTANDLLQADGSSGFLGPGTLSRERLTQPEITDNMDVDEHEFSWTRKAIPPGRRIQVAGALKRFLRSNRLDAVTPSIDREGSVLPLFGESDDEESLDSETWREYEEEEQERLAMEARVAADQGRMLSKDKVIEAVDTVIKDLEAQWIAEKQPKCDRKAWKIWQDARRSPNRLGLIHSAKKLRDGADIRVARFAQEIIVQPWFDDSELRQKAAGFLEEGVSEKKYQDWCIGILESPRQPPKPSALPRPTPKPRKELILDDDEEVLTSDSDDIDDFIEYDDNVVTFPNDEMDIDWDQFPAQRAAQLSPGPDLQADSELPQSLPASSSDESGNYLPPMRPTPKKIKPEKTSVPATPGRSIPPNHEVIMIDSSPSPVEMTDEVPGFDCLEDIERIEEIGIQHWQSVEDAERLVVAILGGWSPEKIARIAKAVNNRDHNEVWDKYILPSIENPKVAEQGSVELDLGQLFDAFISKSAQRLRKSFLRPLTTIRFKREQALFGPFCAHLKRIIRHLLAGDIFDTPSRTSPGTSSKQTPPQDAAGTQSPIDGPSYTSDGSSEDAQIPPSKKRRRQTRKRRDKAAEDLRLKNVKLNEERERRARQLREEIAESGSVPGDKSRLIVNETKEAHESLIYVNDRIGSRIKDHQIEGVRFMWNQVVVDSNVRQGCLLAHTMGLGKTMQVITLLVVIAEASASSDESVRSQIPENLRQSKTLILCPAGLVDNWHDEIIIWAPDGALGPVRRVDSTLAKRDRLSTVREWASGGGVLIIGYTLFTSLVQDDEEIATILWETPNIVVGDEAHQLKNPNSQRHQASANFKTMNRIAMTGSPLTNNVMDYYAMINWVAPGYLADIAEFRERYGNPIKEGLYADSDAYQKRRARKLLKVLNETVGPKVHRKDIQVLLQELPTKKEFIITLPLTDLQMGLYETYIVWARSPAARAQVTGQARAWSLVYTLALVLAHPIIFKTVAEAKKEASKRSKKAAEGGEGNEDEIEAPPDVLHDLLAKVAVRHIEDYALSNKIVVLLRILEECKKVGDKVLVFSQSIATLDYLENIFKRRRVVYQRLDGQTPVTARQNSIRKFNTDANSQVYLISTKAGCVGLNIYGANRVVIFDFKYTPAEEQQAIGRAYRLGQTKPVYVYWLTVGGTFEDTIHNNAIFKTQLASRVVDKKNPDPWSKRFAEYFAMPRIPDQEDLSKALGQDQVLDAMLMDQDIGKLVRKITSTETFEKEETYELSAEDQQDVEKMLELQRLRKENPEEYRRREHEMPWQSRIELGMAPPTTSSYQPLSAEMSEPILAPPHPSTNSTAPASTQPRASQGNTQVVKAIMPPPTGNPKGVSTQESRTTDLQPILATGTQYKTPGPLPSPASLTKPSPAGSSPIAASIMSTPNKASFSATALDQDFTALFDVHNKLHREGQCMRYSPNELVNTVKSVLVQKKVEGLPLMDKMQNLQKSSRNPRFAEAMLAGHIKPEQLASMTRPEMDALSTSLDGLSDAQFKQLVWTSKADLNQLRDRLSIKMETERQKAKGSRELNEGEGDVGNRGTQQNRPVRPRPRPFGSATPEGNRGAIRPGDSAESPHIID
ncbi:ATRX [Madurella fahalii]|uniref:ATRX n=1 Tax=Madurella fahalii TaxID=1157608 RepID=A0ABQ0GS31_9PEZI